MKNVPGPRTDWHECLWLQFLHSVVLLRAAFRLDGEVCAVRSLLRHRAELLAMTSQHIQHMHKALTQMNVQIQHGISDIRGGTGLAVVDALIDGERDAAVLAKLRDPHIKASKETIRKSLESQIPGLRAMILTLFSEVGRDMSRWPTAAQFVSWLALCPDNDISGGRVLWRGVRRVHNRAGHLFRLAAHSLHLDPTALGDYLRRMKSKLGPAGATTATAHKIAIIFYTMVKKQVEYDPTIWAKRDTEREKRFEAKLKRQAQQTGL
jgi:transposase